MVEEASHEMVLVARFATGAEEWVCPVCGRQFIVCWFPHYERIVLTLGNLNVPHLAAPFPLPEEFEEWISTQEKIALDKINF